MRKIANGTSAWNQNQSPKTEPNPVHDCCDTMAFVESVPAWISTPRIASENAASYDSSCAVARTDPRSGYVEPDAQPASITPYTPSPDIARMKSAPIGRSATCR